MADPICRWRNSTVKQACEFVHILPHKPMRKEDARVIVERNWKTWDNSSNFFTTPYQLAAQMGLYYEDGETMHVKFTEDISMDDSVEYLQAWAKRYYAPNPYSKSLTKDDIYGGKPVIINNFLVNWALDNPNSKWEDAIKVLFPNGIGNDDILKNMLNNFSDIKISDGIVRVKGKISRYENIFADVSPDDKAAFFNYFDAYPINPANTCSGNIVAFDYQLTTFILKCVKELHQIDGLDSLTPYLPDEIIEESPIKVSSDNFSLTGMFLKSTNEKIAERNSKYHRWFTDVFTLNGHNVYLSTQWNGDGDFQLTLDDFKTMLDVCYPGTFAYAYHGNKHKLIRKRTTPIQKIYFGTPGTGKSFKVKQILKDEYNIIEEPKAKRKNCDRLFRTTFHPDTDYASFVGCYKPNLDPATGVIKYKFIPQIFTEAYIKAWELFNDATKIEDEKHVFLVIEEINRGNCAQIFGDLFQLLDRGKDGASEYPIKADTDLAAHLYEKLGENHDGFYQGMVKLPANLHIIATMNTSDQSLFPMDSAFKRRWEWEFIPTTPPKGEERTLNLSFDKETKTEHKTIINAGDYEYSWTEFLSKINSKIQKATHSEDKQLGFWFVKANYHSNEISISTFVSKVVFYLWNDVFKDMGAKDTNPFTIVFEGKNQLMSYNSFFETNCEGKVVENIGVLHTFLRNVGMEPNVKDEVIKTLEEAQKLEAEQR